MKTRAQRVTFRAILVTFTIASLFYAYIASLFAYIRGFHGEDPIAMFLAILVPGIVAGLIVAGLVVWVMKAFSEESSQNNDDLDEEKEDNQ